MSLRDPEAWADQVEVVDGSRCIGCGRVEASRPCLGICQDRRARLVELDALVAAIERAEALEARVSASTDFVRLVAMTRHKPRLRGRDASPRCTAAHRRSSQAECDDESTAAR